MDQVIVNYTALQDVCTHSFDEPDSHGPLGCIPDYPNNLSPLQIIEEIQRRYPEKIYFNPDRGLIRQIVGIDMYNAGIRFDNYGMSPESKPLIRLRISSGLLTLFPNIVHAQPMVCTFEFLTANGKISKTTLPVEFIEESYDPAEPQIFIPHLRDIHLDSPVILTSISPIIQDWVKLEEFKDITLNFTNSDFPQWVSYLDLLTEIRLAAEVSGVKTLPRLLTKQTRGIGENNRVTFNISEVITGKCAGLWLHGTSLEYDRDLQIRPINNDNPTMVMPTTSFINALFLLNPSGAEVLYKLLKENKSMCIPFPIRYPGADDKVCNIILLYRYKLGKIYHNIPKFPESGILLNTSFNV